jgi:hypothetical protein
MNITEIKDAIKISYEAKQPLMIWGAPGVGKSAAHKQAADELGVDLIDLRVSLLEPVDIRGYLSQHNGKGVMIGSPLLPTKGKGILFLDEIVQAVPSMQACVSQLILDRRVGEYVLPDGWHVTAAGNRMSDRASTNNMPSHIANRFVHLDAEVNTDAWIDWALKNKIDIRVIAFIKWRPALLHAFTPQAKNLAFPSPRSWAFVSNLLARKMSPALLHNFIRGAIGEGAAAEFIAFLQVWDKMPSIDAILLNPKTADIPTGMAVLYAVVTSVAARANVDNIGKIVDYFNRLTDEASRPEFSVMAMKEIIAGEGPRKQKIANTRPFIEWAAKHSHMLA